jgi:hypothetical protein
LAVEVTLRGSEELRRAAAQLRAEAAGLTQRVLDATQRGTRGFAAKVAQAVPAYMPSGYSPVLAPAIRTRTYTRLGPEPAVTLRVYARGRSRERDVERLNRGVLRHPLFGDRGHWYGQVVRRGFVSTTFRRQRSEIIDAIDAALDEITARVERG